MDASSDGNLEFDEFVAGAKAFAPPLDDTQAMYAFKGFDTDDNHRITADEFFGVLSLGHFFQTEEAVHSASASLSLPSPPPTRFDCDGGLKLWEIEWSSAKQKWCCEREHKGCGSMAGKSQHSLQSGAAPLEESPHISMQTFMTRMGTSLGLPEKQFHKFDNSSDGVIVLSELVARGAEFTSPLTQGEGVVAMKGFDANSDNKITMAEYSGAVREQHFYQNGAQEPITLKEFLKRMSDSDQPSTDVFDAVDRDNDGSLDLHDFQQAPRTSDAKLTQREAQYAFAGLDVDGDGRVSRHEFLAVAKVGRFYPTPHALRAASLAAGDDRQPRQQASSKTGAAAASEALTGGLRKQPVVIEPSAAAPRLATTPPPPPPPSATVQPQPQPPTAAAAAVTAAGAPAATAASTTSPETAATPAWELHRAPIDVRAFLQRMGPQLPKRLKALDLPNGSCVDLAGFRDAAPAFDPPLTREEADYAFCGMDENHDKRVCPFEFSAVLRLRHFFPSRSQMEHLRGVGEVLHRGAAPEARSDLVRAARSSRTHNNSQRSSPEPRNSFTVPGKALHGSELGRYHGIPAIVSGRARMQFKSKPSSDFPKAFQYEQAGRAFAHAMEEQLGLSVNIAAVESFTIDGGAHPTLDSRRSRNCVILWTAGSTDDGGSLLVRLQRKAASIEKQIEDTVIAKHLSWLAQAQLWTKVSLSFYGPHAHSLAAGRKISQEIGDRHVAGSMNGSPAYAVPQ